jgi:hypothetical protein
MIKAEDCGWSRIFLIGVYSGPPFLYWSVVSRSSSISRLRHFLHIVSAILFFSQCCAQICLDINIPLYLALYVGWKVFKKTKVWKPTEMDFVTVCILDFVSIRSLKKLFVVGNSSFGRYRDTRSASTHDWRKDCRFLVLVSNIMKVTGRGHGILWDSKMVLSDTELLKTCEYKHSSWTTV